MTMNASQSRARSGAILALLFALLLLAGACTGGNANGPGDNTAEVIKERKKSKITEALGIPEDAVTNFDKATSLMNQESPELVKAEELLQKSLAEAPNFLEAQYNLGVVQEKRGRYGDAIGAYQKAMEQDKLNSHTVKFLLAIGRAQALDNKAEDAVKTFEEVLRLEPENVDILNSLAAAHLTSGKTEEAIEYVTKVLREDNQNLTALNTLAQTYTVQDNRSMALYVFKKAARIALGATKNDEDLSAEPSLLVLEGKYDKENTDKGLAADLINNLGLIYMKQDRIPFAVYSFNAAAELDPTHVESRLNIGAIYLRYLNYDGAAKTYGEALNSSPGSCSALLGLSASEFAQGERDKSLEHYQTFLKDCNAKDASVHLQMQRIYERKQEFQNAIKHCEEFVAIAKPGPEEPVTGEYCKALAQMEKMARENPMGAEGEGGELPPEGEEMLPEGEELPPEGEELPPEGEEIPAEEGAAPAEGGEAPAEEGAAPAEGGEAPAAPAEGTEAPAEEKKSEG